MQRHVPSILALGLVLATFGCGDQTNPATPPLRLSTSSIEVSTCNFESVSSLAATYFGETDEGGTVAGLIEDMQTAFEAETPDTTTTRSRGFDVMSHIASQVKAGNNDSQDASSLTNELLKCMFFSAAELPATFPEDFTTATNPTLDGAYDVRGGPPVDPDNDPRQRVYARPTTLNPETGFPINEGFAGIAPAPGSETVLSWSQVIHTTSAPARVLLYGKPGSNSQSYDWRAVPRTVSYTAPGSGGFGAIAGLCVVGSSTLVHESGNTFTGFNPFADAYFIDPSLCQTFAVRRSRWSPLRLFDKLFGVQPLWGNPGGVGGLTGGHSEFDADQTQMTVIFAQQPPATVKVCQPESGKPNAGCPTGALFQVSVATSGTGTRADGTMDTGSVGPVKVRLNAKNNNGTPEQLCMLIPPDNTTFVCVQAGDAQGTNITAPSGGPPSFAPATFVNLFFTKPGAERLVANGNIPQRSITAQVTSNKLNVKP